MKTIPWLLGLAILAMCLGLGSGCNPPPQLVSVPNLVGQTQAMAGSMLAIAQLITGTVTQQCDNNVPAGLVISQTPLAATMVATNSAVDFVISTGPCSVTVPNVVGQTQAGAGTTLAAAVLVTGTVTQQCDNNVAAGLVISQTPLAGSPALPGSQVNLVISTGPCSVIVPNVVGQTQPGAGTTLTGANLIVGTVTQQCDNNVAAGLVISQNPLAGSPALPGSPVDVVISTGPCSVIVPNVVGQTQGAAATAITGANLIVGTVTQQCSNSVPAGSVISQNPLAGSPALPGSAVDLVISTGPCSVIVPSVTGQTQAGAGATLAGAGLTVGTVTFQCSNNVAVGLVISQNPLAGIPALPNSPVDLVISTGPCSVTVPNVVGQTQGAAGAAITGANLIVGTVTQQCSNSVPAGAVISQNPLGGASALPGSAVDLVISTGPCSVTVPSVTGQTQNGAGNTLSGAGLTVGTVTFQCSNNVAAGLVISQNPLAGASALPNSPVNIVVSTGPCSVTVPNVVGQTQGAAGTAITGANLIVGTVTQQCSNSVPAGSVISQNPLGGASALPGSAVDLVISTGPCSVTVPGVTGQTQNSAGAAIIGAGLIVGTVTFQCDNTVPSGSVISQNPLAGASALPNSPVDLVISTGPCNVTVPNVTGQALTGGTTLPSAGATLTAAGLTIGTVTYQCSNTVAAGLVISQNPLAGASVLPGSAVDLVVSTGPCSATVPNVTGQTQNGAGAAISAAGLIIGTVSYQCDNTVPAGLVISQNPLAGASVLPGSAVDLVVSTGPCPVTVPSVVNQLQSVAGTTLSGSNLVVGTVTQQCSNTVAAGLVISQTPLAGTLVPPGTAVDLVISTGPCPVNVPNVVGQALQGGTTLPSATNTIIGAGLTVGTITYKCSPVDATGLPLYPAGTVISQNPAAGTPVPPGTPVDLIVSTGPC